MHVIFTDKLRKMVAHYKNFTWYDISIEHLFLNTSWQSGEESIQYQGQDLLAEKTLSVTLNDISCRNDVKASL